MGGLRGVLARLCTVEGPREIKPNREPNRRVRYDCVRSHRKWFLPQPENDPRANELLAGYVEVRPRLQENDQLTISEFADLFGFPVAALTAAIERKRGEVNKPFYSIPELAKRWNCSRGTIYNILREAEFKLLNLTRKGKDKGKWLIPASVVKRIEENRMELLPQVAA